MKTAIIVVSVVSAMLASARSLSAQLTVALDRLPDDMTGIKVRNDAAATVSAFSLCLTYVHRKDEQDATLIVYIDPVTDATVEPLLAHQERVVRPEKLIIGDAKFGRYGFPLFEQRIISAAIYADGATVGDAALLTRLLLRRSNLLLAVETARDILFDAGRHNVPKDQLIGQFKKAAASLDHWYLLPEQQAGRSVYQLIIEKLMSLPEGSLGTPFPPTSFVSQETAILNRQRIALLESEPRLGNPAPIRPTIALQSQ